MITTGILYLFYGLAAILTYPLRQLSDVSAENGLITSITTVSEWFSSVSAVVPVGTLITVFSLYFAMTHYVGIYKIISWIRGV